MVGLGRADLALWGSVFAAALALVVSAWAAQAVGLIFHLHPAAVPAGAALLYRWALGGRPCTPHLVAFLGAMVVLIGIYQEALAPIGLADPPALTALVGLAGVAFAARILLRRDATATAWNDAQGAPR